MRTQPFLPLARTRTRGSGRREWSPGPSSAVALLLALGVGALHTAAQVTDPTLQVARSSAGVVAAATPFAAEAGARVLAQGGNAVDAAVATAFALAVTEPSMSGLGGRTSIVIRTPDGRVHGIDGLNQVPRGYRPGVAPEAYDRAAIPGVPAALGRALAEHGTWPLARVLEPAIRLAEEGFPLPEAEAGRFSGAADELRRHEGALGTYLKADGSPHVAGEVFRQPLLARVLRALADGGVDVFYRGWVADSIAADMARNGGFVDREALAGYEALDAIQVRGRYRGLELVSNFRPASGHSVIQALQMLEALDPTGACVGEGNGEGETKAEAEARWAALLGQAMGLALADRNQRGESEEESARRLTSAEHARERAGQVRVPEPVHAACAPAAGASATTGWSAAPAPAAVRAPALAAHPPRGVLVTDPSDREATTAMAAADASGTVVTLTQSLGPSMGARLVAPGLGFLYATRLGSEPGSRPSSTIAPTLVLDERARPLLALGGAGDARIISAVIQVISRVVDRGTSLEAALAAPRVHPEGANGLRVEEGPVAEWSPEAVDVLDAWGFELIPSPSGYFGRVHAVAPLELDGSVLGVAEPRWTGGAAGPGEGGPGGREALGGGQELPYSEVVRTGDTYWFAGKVGATEETRALATGRTAAETRNVLEAFRATFERLGLTFGDVVNANVYLAEIDDFAEMNAVYREYFPTDPPARTTVGVAALPGGAWVEIAFVAVAGRQDE